jgi:hypothetical protein
MNSLTFDRSVLPDKGCVLGEDGISEMFLHGKELEKFQEENKNLITDRIIEVAEKFCVEPIDLIGHVLEYRIEQGEIK